ncbi:MAG: glycosyltransferase [Pelagibacterales bacterium]|nr:glycosyltransferase [Pelagibacterales bacterium]
MKNKFSIITVVKNDKQNILTTLNSVKNQSFSKYEHIILDGNSYDGTSEVIKKNLHKKIKYFRRKDKNLYDAINTAISKSTGDYVFLLHSGDFFFNSEVIKNINSYFSKKEDFIYGNLIYYQKFSIKRIWRYNSKKLNYNNAYKIAHPTLVIKRDLLKKIKYNINFKISSDTDFLIKLLKFKKLKHRHIDKYFIFMLSGGLSTSFQNLFLKISEDIKIYLNHFRYMGIFIYFYKILTKLKSIFINKRDINRLKFILIKEYKFLKK